MNFINTGLDDQILKSLDAEHPTEELVKAMNKQGLVQKEVTVQGKNGTFTRKQWVKASEAKDAGTSQSTMTQEEFNKKYPNGGMQDPVECLKHNGSDATWHGEKLQNPSVMKRAKEEYAQFKKDKAALEAGKSESSKTSVKKDSKSNKPSLSDIQGYGYDPSTATGDPTYLKIGDKGYYKIGNNKWQYNPSQGSALGGTYTDSQISDIVSKTSEEVKVIPSAKKNNNNTFKDYLEADKAGEADAGKTSKNDKKVIDAVKTQYIDNIYRKGKGMSDSQHESLCKKIAKQCRVSEFNVWYEMTKQFTEFTNESDKKLKLGTTNQKFKDLSKMSESELKDRMKQVTTRMSELFKEMNSNSKAHGQLNSVATQAQKKEYDELVEENGNLMAELGKRKPAQQPEGGQKYKSSEVFNCTKFNTEEQLIDAFDEAINSGEDSTSDYDVNKVVVTKVEKYMGNGVKGRGTTPRVRITAEVSGVQNGKPFTKETTLSTLDTTKSSQSSAGQKLSPADAKKKTQEVTKGVSDKKSFMEKAKAQGITWKENDHEGINWMRCCMAMNKHFENGGSWNNDVVTSNPTIKSPLSVKTKSGRGYSIFMDGTHIKGSIPGKEDSRAVRDIIDFTSQGFSTIEEVKEYVANYF